MRACNALITGANSSSVQRGVIFVHQSIDDVGRRSFLPPNRTRDGLSAICCLRFDWTSCKGTVRPMMCASAETYVHLMVDDPSLLPLQTNEPIIPLMVIVMTVYVARTPRRLRGRFRLSNQHSTHGRPTAATHRRIPTN